MTQKQAESPSERNARRALRRRATQVARLVQDASDVVLILDLNGGILDGNDAAVREYGYSHSELRHLNIRDLTPNDQVGQMANLLSQASHGQPIESIQCRRVDRDGRHRDMWLTITPLRLKSDLPVAVMTTESRVENRVPSSSLRIQLFNRFLSAQEDERQLLAHELHDETGQLITALLRKLESIEDAQSMDAVRAEVPAVRELAETVLQEVKRIAHGLRPGELDVLGLEEALRSYAKEFSDTHQIPVDVHLGGLTGVDLAIDSAVCLYRIAQETLTNVARHAKAHCVSLIVVRRDGELSMIIEDDGAGFDFDSTMNGANQSQGLGLYGIQERAQAVGGHATIESSPGHGTSIHVKISISQ